MKKSIYNGIVFLALTMGCKYDALEPRVDCSFNGPQIFLEEKTDATCGSDNGLVRLSAIGGDGDYTFTYNQSGVLSSTGVFSILRAGNYTFIVVDGNGCADSLAVQIANVDGVVIESISTEMAQCGVDDGSITIQATGGTAPYQYTINEGTPQDESTFDNLGPGTYTVQVTDADDCQFADEVSITTGVSLETDIVPILEANCTLSSCHGGSRFPDLRDTDNILDQANRIKARTGNGTMPPGGGLSQAQIDAIACWVDDGALDN